TSNVQHRTSNAGCRAGTVAARLLPLTPGPSPPITSDAGEALLRGRGGKAIASRLTARRADSDDRVNGVGPFDADQALVEAAVKVTQSVGVQAHLVQGGGVHVLDVELVLDRLRSQRVGRAVAGAPF